MNVDDPVTSKHRKLLEDYIEDSRMTGSVLAGILANLPTIKSFLGKEEKIGFVLPKNDPTSIENLVACEHAACYVMKREDGVPQVWRSQTVIFTPKFDREAVIGDLQVAGKRYGFFVNEQRIAIGSFYLYDGGILDQQWHFKNHQIHQAIFYNGRLYTLTTDHQTDQMAIWDGEQEIRRHPKIEHIQVDSHGLSYLYEAGRDWYLTNASLEALSQTNTERLGRSKPDKIAYHDGWWAYWLEKNKKVIEIDLANNPTDQNFSFPVSQVHHLEVITFLGSIRVLNTTVQHRVTNIQLEDEFYVATDCVIHKIITSDSDVVCIVEENGKQTLFRPNGRTVMSDEFEEIQFAHSQHGKMLFAGRIGKRWQINWDGYTICRCDQVFDLKIEKGPVFGPSLVVLIRRGRQLIKVTRLLGS